jgi:hypothetical protein
MRPEVVSGSSSAGSRVLVAMGSVKDRQSDAASVIAVGNNAVAIRGGVKICVLMCNETVSLVG